MKEINKFVYHLNNYCNLHCEHCSDFCNMPFDKNSKWLERRSRWEFPMEEVELFCKRFDGISLDKPLHLTGGEPTCLPVNKFNKMIDIFSTYRRRIVLVTNGYNIFGVGKSQLKKCQEIKVDDHSINNEHAKDCVRYLSQIGAHPRHIYTPYHYDLGATMKLDVNKSEKIECRAEGRRSWQFKNQVEIIVKQGVVYPCCAQASFDNYNNNTRMRDELTKAGWHLKNPMLLENIRNFKKTLPTYVFDQCKNNCWWPNKRILGKVKITKKPNDIIKKT